MVLNEIYNRLNKKTMITKQKQKARLNIYVNELVNHVLFTAVHLQNPFNKKPRKKRLLLVRTDSIGDFILFSPCLQYYRNLFPDYEITLVLRNEVAPLAELCPHVDAVWKLEWSILRYSFIERFKLQRKISKHGFSIAINLMYSLNLSLADAMIGWSLAPRRIAFTSLGSRKRCMRYYTELVPDDAKNKFEMDRNFDLIRYLGYSGEIVRQSRIWTSLTDENTITNFLSTLGCNKFAVLFPSAQNQIRMWSKNKFIETIIESSKLHPLYWLVCGSEAEANLCNDIAKELDAYGINATSITGKVSLRVSALIVRESVFCLANESMAVHMAAAMNIPTVCILGGGHHGRFFPYPGNPLTVAVTHETDCYHCNWNCRQERISCIEDISVEQVVIAINNLLPDH